MPDHDPKAPLESDLLKQSLLYRQFRAQLEEINKHKWLESERVGHDIGFDHAQADWTLKYRSRWLRHWRQQSQPRRADEG
jgi:hypothetical protein